MLVTELSHFLVFSWALRTSQQFKGGASSEKCEMNGGGVDVIFQSKGIRNYFVSFFFVNFCRILGSVLSPAPLPPWRRHYNNCIRTAHAWMRKIDCEKSLVLFSNFLQLKENGEHESDFYIKIETLLKMQSDAVTRI